MQGKVQRPCARVAAPRGGEHLQFVRRNAHLVGKARFAQLDHGFDKAHAVAAGKKEKVIRCGVFQLGRHPGVDKVRVAHDHRLPGLTENVAQGDGRDAPAANEVGKYVPRADARQLVWVADEHEAAAGAQRRKQRPHEREVDHRGLVHDERVGLERLLFPLGEGDLAGLLVPCHAEHPVDGLRVARAQLAHALGGTARGRGKEDGKSHALKERDDGAHARRLTRAGAAGEQQQLFFCRKLNGLTLERRILHALLALDLFDGALHAAQGVGLVGEYRLDARRDIGLVLPRRAQIAGRHVRDGLLHDAVQRDEIVEALFRGVNAAVEQLGGRGKELFAREKDVPARVAVVRELECQPRLGAKRRVAAKAHRERDLVADGKVHAERAVGQKIGVALERRHRVHTEAAIERYAERGGQVVMRQEFHHAAKAHLLVEGI